MVGMMYRSRPAPPRPATQRPADAQRSGTGAARPRRGVVWTLSGVFGVPQSSRRTLYCESEISVLGAVIGFESGSMENRLSDMSRNLTEPRPSHERCKVLSFASFGFFLPSPVSGAILPCFSWIGVPSFL